MTEEKRQTGWKQKLIREITEYWINFMYLAVFFGVMITYRRLILKEYEISYLNYGIAAIEAAILAKIIMIGDIMRLGRRYEDKPLVVPTIHKTIIFGILVIGFKIVEHLVRGLLHGKGLAEGLHVMISERRDEMLAYALVMFSAFIPFFAMRELGRVLGEGKIRALFFRGRTAVDLGQTPHD